MRAEELAAMAFAAIRWRIVWRIAVRLVAAGQRIRANLTGDEWSELTGLVRKAVGGRSRRTPWTNLTSKERSRLGSLVLKAATGRGGAKH
jgi:hypothetical protein